MSTSTSREKTTVLEAWEQDIQSEVRKLIQEMEEKLASAKDITFQELDRVRDYLKLSGRQICLLLKMDASAWSRWSKSESIPRHVYRSLSWYVQLLEQTPHIHLPHKLEKKMHAQKRELEMRLFQLKKEVEKFKNQMPQKENLSDVGHKVQEAFENVLLKFRDQVFSQKAFEIESLKYENARFKEKITDLQDKVLKVVDQLKEAQETTQKKVKRSVTKKVSKQIASGKAAKKKLSTKLESLKKKVSKKVGVKKKKVAKKASKASGTQSSKQALSKKTKVQASKKAKSKAKKKGGRTQPSKAKGRSSIQRKGTSVEAKVSQKTKNVVGRKKAKS